MNTNAAYLYLALAILSVNLAVQSTSNAQNIRTVVLSSQVTPGAGNNVEFTTFFQAPSLNDINETAFGAFFTGPGVGSGNDLAIFREATGAGLGMVARAGMPANGAGPGANYAFFDPPVLNKHGDVAFHATLAGMGVTGISDTGIFREGMAAGVSLVARKGNTAPTAAINVDYAGFSQLKFAATGQTAFVADLAGPGVNATNDVGVFREMIGPGVDNVARAGELAAGIGPGVFYSDFPNMLLNDAGQIAMLAELDGPNVNSTNDQGIFREGIGGQLELVARSGDIAPIGGGVMYESFRVPDFNELGLTAFFAQLNGVGVNSTNNEALFRQSAGMGVSLSYRTGNPAPGTDAGVNFEFFGNPILNDLEKIAFVAGLTGTGVDASNDLAIFRETSTGSLEMVARTGDPAPGTTATFSSFSKPTFNNLGQVAFVGILAGSDVDSSNDMGVFVQDQFGQLKLVVREGDEMDVSDDSSNSDLRVVSDGSFGSLEDETIEVNGFNDAGRLVFFAEFEDGSQGVFVANSNVLLGDLNGDGAVNLLDVAPFVDAIIEGMFVEQGDINQDGLLDLLDVSPFVDLLTG